MADRKNMQLSDEMMANAAGGAGEAAPEPKYNIGDRVVYVHDNSTLVIESRDFMQGPVLGEWVYVGRDPENANRFVSGPDMLFRPA